MYLKSVEIFGYKSFAAKTRLEFEPGITAIVGPNGSGKSNINEAIRWCLGEMSWKALRAGSMLDVIFAGTSKRPALSMAEVTLHVDNASGQLPVPYSEVTVTRRIYRSGESEYYLNKTQCRLRDIRELFLDTGIGGEGYAIIDQGGVDFILNSKPEDRRSIFEEAAGVAKYKAKRDEALRKLERVEQDLLRLQDSLSSINEQVKKLDSDARKAKLYKKYQEELSALEAAHVLSQLGQIQVELDALCEKMRPVEERVGQLKVSLDAEGAYLSALNLERADQQNQVAACGQKIGDVQSRMARLEERGKAAHDQLSEIADRRARVESDLARTVERLAGIDARIDKARQELDAAKAQFEAGQREAEGIEGAAAAADGDARQAEAACEALRSERQALAQRTLDARRSLSGSESELGRCEAELRAALRQLDRDQAEAQSKAAELDAARASVSAQKDVAAEAQRGRESSAALLQELQAAQQAATTEGFRLYSELSVANGRLQALEAEGQQNAYWAGAQSVLAAGIEGVVGTVRQMMEAPEPARAALEDVLGERLFAVVCENSDAARAGVEYLAASGKGRARFLVLSAVPTATADRSYPEQAKPLLAQVTCEPRFRSALSHLLTEVYVLGGVLYGDHWVFGGAESKSDSKPRLSDFSEVRLSVETLSSKHAETEGLKAKIEADASEAAKFLRETEMVAAQATERLVVLQAGLSHREESKVLAERNAEFATETAAAHLKESARLLESIAELRVLVGQAEAAEKTGAEAVESAARVASDARERAASIRSSRDAVLAKLAPLEKAMQLQGDAHNAVVLEKEQLDAAASASRDDIAELERRKALADDSVAKAREELATLSSEHAALQAEAARLHGRLTELNVSVAEKQTRLSDLKIEHDAAIEELHGHQVAAGGLRSRQDLLRTRLWDERRLTEEEAKNLYSNAAVDPERLESLRKKIANMGNINLAAPEEYEALAQKQTFLNTQITDLNQAKEDLRNAVQKINATTRENFRQTFQEVREHFRRIFGTLFEGGEADLILTDPENILETGVDMVAQPPGKRLQHLSLLSGGEKTLTAIALLFAFFMVRPSPFCMLDEADAALDDANVERFVALLKEFGSRTQFLIVSHNKRTMEAAEAIYGVTMEEMGVSQIVSVEFKKRDRSAAPTPKLERPSAPPLPAPKPSLDAQAPAPRSEAGEPATATIAAAEAVPEAAAPEPPKAAETQEASAPEPVADAAEAAQLVTLEAQRAAEQSAVSQAEEAAASASDEAVVSATEAVIGGETAGMIAEPLEDAADALPGGADGASLDDTHSSDDDRTPA